MMRASVLVLLGLLLGVLPVIRHDGQLWVIPALSAVTVYYGVRPNAVYGVLAFLFVSEVVYGGDVGSVNIAFIITVIMCMILHRFIALSVWALQDGWRIVDASRTVVVSWVFSWCVLAMSAIVGDVLYGYGFVANRIALFWTYEHMLMSILVISIVVIVTRRITVPFRQAIRFGS